MAREFSAGGVVLRRMQAQWWVAVIQPQRKRQPGTPDPRPILALPKGLVDQGEKPEETAVREVREETGVEATVVCKLRDIKYVYVRTWGDRQRVFKIVSFFLLLYCAGKLGDIRPEMRHEVREASWLPMEEAARQLSYPGEREVVKQAQEYVAAHPEL